MEGQQSLTTLEAMMTTNIDSMVWENGFDVIIVCCSSGQQARYWQRRLDDNRGTLLPSNCVVLAVKEDWPGGAGNGLALLLRLVFLVLTLRSLGDTLCLQERC
jgi:hypothetical protein